MALPAGGFAYQGTSLLIESNDFVDNWGGVVLYENSDRGCALSSDNYCTLDNTSTYTMASCAQSLPGAVIGGTHSAYAEGCRWKTQNVTVSDNTFDFTPSDIGSDCTTSVYCGFNGLFATGGSTPGALASVGFTGGSQYTGGSFAVSSTPSTLTVSSTESCGGQTVQNPGETCFAPGSPSPAYLDINGDVFSYTGVSPTSFTGVSYDFRRQHRTQHALGHELWAILQRLAVLEPRSQLPLRGRRHPQPDQQQPEQQLRQQYLLRSLELRGIRPGQLHDPIAMDIRAKADHQGEGQVSCARTSRAAWPSSRFRRSPSPD